MSLSFALSVYRLRKTILMFENLLCVTYRIVYSEKGKGKESIFSRLLLLHAGIGIGDVYVLFNLSDPDALHCCLSSRIHGFFCICAYFHSQYYLLYVLHF